MPPPMPIAISFVLAAAVSGALRPPTPGPTDAVGPLPEGDGGYFCKTHDGAERLFRRGDFYFCGRDAHLPSRVTYALLGEAPALPAAAGRFARTLEERVGIVFESGLRPDVVFVASPARPIEGAPAQRKAAAAMLATSGVTLPPDLEKLVIDGVSLNHTAVFSSDTTSYRGRAGLPALTVVGFYAGPGADLDHVVKEAFTTFLGIAAPLVRPEGVAKQPGGVTHSFRLRPWLGP